MTSWEVYWWLKLDSIAFVASLLAWFGFLASVGITIFYLWGNYLAIQKLKWAWIITIPLMLLSTVIPTTKQYAVIKVFPMVVNSEIAQELPEHVNNMYKMAKDYLKGMLKEGNN